MARLEHLADRNSPLQGKVVGIITSITLVLAGFLSVVSFAAI